MSSFAAIVCVLGCALSLASAAPVEVSPALEHPSNKKFLNDFPVDTRAALGKEFPFDHPFPLVQDSEDFDADFTKDENSDGGKWQAQMDYDIMRTKVVKAERALAQMKKMLEKETADVAMAKKELSKKSAETTAAKAARTAAADGVTAASGKVTTASGEVTSSTGQVEKEMKDLVGCQKKITDAEQHLKDLLAKQAELEKKLAAEKIAAEKKAAAEQLAKQAAEMEAAEKQREIDRKASEKLAVEKKMSEAEAAKELSIQKEVMAKHMKKMESYEGQKDEYKIEMEKYTAAAEKAKLDYTHKLQQQQKDVREQTATMKAHDVVWKKKIAADKEEAFQSAAAFDKATKAVEKMEAELKKASATLKPYRRRPHVDDDGGVYDVGGNGLKLEEKASTVTSSLSMFTLAALLGSLLH